MRTWMKVLLCTALSFVFCFTCIGYAALSTTLSITGTVSAEPSFEEMVITNVTVCSDTTASQSVSVVRPTNVKSTITGDVGQTVVYQITAHNYSETETYVYTGAIYSEEYADVADNVTISASNDEANSDRIPASSASHYYEGTPVAPGEEIVFYVTYTLNASVSGDMMVNFKFVPVVYTVTYLVDNELYAVDCIVDNTVAYTVREDTPSKEGMVFADWVNANAEPISSYPAGNTNSYTLSAKWENAYLIIFVDNDGDVIYQETFTDSSTSLSAEGQSIVDAKLAELAVEAAGQDMSVSWSDYDIANATSDITVRPIFNYEGYLNLVPMDSDSDGIVDFYEVHAVDTLPQKVVVPGVVGGIPVTTIYRITNIDGENDWDNFENTVTEIVIEEGVEVLEWNALAWTPNLSVVHLPSTLTLMGKNAFSRNIAFGGFGRGDDKKSITIHYDGTIAEWNAVVAASNAANDGDHWEGGLEEGTQVICTDGYIELTSVNSILGRYTWTEHPNG